MLLNEKNSFSNAHLRHFFQIGKSFINVFTIRVTSFAERTGNYKDTVFICFNQYRQMTGFHKCRYKITYTKLLPLIQSENFFFSFSFRILLNSLLTQISSGIVTARIKAITIYF